MKFMKTFFFSILSVVLVAAAAFGQTTEAAKAAEQRGREMAGLIARGDRGEYRKWLAAHFSEAMLKRPIARHLETFSWLHDSSRGYEIIGVHEAKESDVTLVARNKLTGGYEGLIIFVEAAAPYKISGLGVRPVPAPENRSGKLTDKEIATEIESIAKRLAEADVFSGTILLAKDGRTLYKAAFGNANKDFGVPNRIDTKFNLGSMNKMFTGVAIAQLVEKGKLSYEDPLSKFIPDFPNAEAAKKIRIKHLLTHTSGLGGYFSDRFQEMSRSRLRTVDDMMALAREDEKDLQFEPGSKWEYSNTGMLVLGKVIEIVTGQSYFDYVRENIYKPAGMVNTDCYELDKVNPNLAVGYEKTYTDEGIRWENNVFEHVMRGGPQGGGYSTVEDLLRFDQALRSGKLVSAETLRLLTSPKPELNSPRYGYGFYAAVDGGPTGHSGGFPGISSNLSMHLGSGWTAIVLSNYGRSTMQFSNRIDTLIGNAK
ncbi:MAG: serine hydrolase domain-containing protein [Pyrinomonadaceae bacterium]|nr:serine hydrolase domain-containing protein [Pyrinomonadaceae bacterium]